MVRISNNWFLLLLGLVGLITPRNVLQPLLVAATALWTLTQAVQRKQDTVILFWLSFFVFCYAAGEAVPLLMDLEDCWRLHRPGILTKIGAKEYEIQHMSSVAAFVFVAANLGAAVQSKWLPPLGWSGLSLLGLGLHSADEFNEHFTPLGFEYFAVYLLNIGRMQPCEPVTDWQGESPEDLMAGLLGAWITAFLMVDRPSLPAKVSIWSALLLLGFSWMGVALLLPLPIDMIGTQTRSEGGTSCMFAVFATGIVCEVLWHASVWLSSKST